MFLGDFGFASDGEVEKGGAVLRIGFNILAELTVSQNKGYMLFLHHSHLKMQQVLKLHRFRRFLTL